MNGARDIDEQMPSKRLDNLEADDDRLAKALNVCPNDEATPIITCLQRRIDEGTSR